MVDRWWTDGGYSTFFLKPAVPERIHRDVISTFLLFSRDRLEIRCCMIGELQVGTILLGKVKRHVNHPYTTSLCLL